MRNTANKLEKEKSKQTTDDLLKSFRTKFSTEDSHYKLQTNLQEFGKEIVDLKLKVDMKRRRQPETRIDTSIKLLQTNPEYQRQCYKEISTLNWLAIDQTDALEEGRFASMVRPNKSSAAKVRTAFDTLLEERGIPPIAQEEVRTR